MTLITFQDGQPVLRGGKVGTEQACCCGQSCQCTAYSPEFINLSCQIDYISFDIEISFPLCNGNTGAKQGTLLLQNPGRLGLYPWWDAIDLNDAGAACDYLVYGGLGCGTSTNALGEILNRWHLWLVVDAGTCCGNTRAICYGSFTGWSAFGLFFPIGAREVEGACCPDVPASDLTFSISSAYCEGETASTVKVLNVNIVYL
jgi:hypothetical protein